MERTSRTVLLAGIAALLLCLPGCSLFVMAGKMFFGDPVVDSDFTRFTGVSLDQSNKRLLVLCSTPHSITAHYPSIDIDILDGVTRRLKTRGVSVVDPDDVATWLDDNGSWENLGEMAEEFNADFIVHIDLDRLTYREHETSDLFRGRALGSIYGYEVREVGGQREALEIFTQEYTSEYPRSYPISADQKSAAVFEKEYLDRLCSELALRFYDHRFSEKLH